MNYFVKTLTAATAVSALFAATAYADVQVIGTVDKVENVDIDLTTNIDKSVDVTVEAAGSTTGSAQSLALVNATIADSTVDAGAENEGAFEGDPNDQDIDKEVLLTDSVNVNTGIVQLNQDAGNISNQGNIVSAAIVFGDPETDSTTTISEAYADQKITRSDTTHLEGRDNLPDDITDLAAFETDLAATISGSVVGNTGIVHVNQNVGNFNNQHNILSAAIGTNALVALSDAGLGQELTGNSVTDVNTVKAGIITASVNGNTGVVNVNQATGHFNNQATVVSISALSSSVGL